MTDSLIQTDGWLHTILFFSVIFLGATGFLGRLHLIDRFAYLIFYLKGLFKRLN